jgi:dihydrofolate reductase
MSQIAIVVAMARNRTIGINNTLPWRCPADLKHFRALTMGHHLIMGRKTFQSIGRPLPGRTTVVVSRNRGLQLDGCIVANSVADALGRCADDPQVFVVGGAELYAQTLEIADVMYLTEVQKDVPGDAAFPQFDLDAWQEVAREPHSQSEPEPLEFHFVEYRHRKQR